MTTAAGASFNHYETHLSGAMMLLKLRDVHHLNTLAGQQMFVHLMASAVSTEP